MKKEDLIALGLTEELAEKVAAASTEELKGYIPKSRFDEVNAAKKTAESQLAERDKQIKDFKKSAGDNEELKAKLEAAETANKEAAKKHNAEMKQLMIDHAIAEALTGAKAKNNTAVKALLDLSAIDIDEAGKVTGLSKQIAKLAETEDTKFLFDVAEPAAQAYGKPHIGGLSGVKPQQPDNNSGAGGAESIGAQFAKAYGAQFAPQGNQSDSATV